MQGRMMPARAIGPTTCHRQRGRRDEDRILDDCRRNDLCRWPRSGRRTTPRPCGGSHGRSGPCRRSRRCAQGRVVASSPGSPGQGSPRAPSARRGHGRAGLGRLRPRARPRAGLEGPSPRLAQERRSESARARRGRRFRAVRRTARQRSGRVHEHSRDGLCGRHAVVAGLPNGAHVVLRSRRDAPLYRAGRPPVPRTPEDLRGRRRIDGAARGRAGVVRGSEGFNRRPTRATACAVDGGASHGDGSTRHGGSCAQPQRDVRAGHGNVFLCAS